MTVNLFLFHFFKITINEVRGRQQRVEYCQNLRFCKFENHLQTNGEWKGYLRQVGYYFNSTWKVSLPKLVYLRFCENKLLSNLSFSRPQFPTSIRNLILNLRTTSFFESVQNFIYLPDMLIVFVSFSYILGIFWSTAIFPENPLCKSHSKLQTPLVAG